MEQLMEYFSNISVAYDKGQSASILTNDCPRSSW